MRSFKDLDVWKYAILIAKKTYTISSFLPKEEQYGLKSQMNRAAVSISSNIAEGCSRNSEKDFKRFLEVALGSAFELESQILLMIELKIQNQIEPSHIQELLELINQEQRMLNAFIAKLKERINE
jgi:four helix bundle protein